MTSGYVARHRPYAGRTTSGKVSLYDQIVNDVSTALPSYRGGSNINRVGMQQTAGSRHAHAVARQYKVQQPQMGTISR